MTDKIKGSPNKLLSTHISRQASVKMPRPSNDSDDQPKKFDLQAVMPRKRLGMVRHVVLDKKFAFIDAEDYEDDVFFHFEVFEPAREGQIPVEYMPVEYELDEQHRRDTDKLKARAVRQTQRPMGRRLVARDAPRLQIRHHPNSRRLRPDWRKKEDLTDQGGAPPNQTPDVTLD